MKRSLFFILALVMFLLSACTTAGSESTAEVSETEGSAMVDNQAPSIRILVTEVEINKGEEYNLLDGVSAKDNIDGNITDKIVIDDGGFDPNVAGIYTITYTLMDSSGNEAVPKTRTITVKEVAALMKAPEIWNGAIEGEKLNPKPAAVFGGAWYHKVVSSKDKWVGIETIVTLPEFDIRRYDGEYDDTLSADPSAKNLDNPSVYLGGNAKTESDVGLSLSRALIDVNSQTLSTGNIAFRPFWRYITSEEKDEGGYDVHDGEYAVSANGNNCIANYHWKYTEYYYLPGDKLRIIVFSPEPNKLQLQIEVLEKSTLPSAVAMREEYGWNDPADFISPIFRSTGHGTGGDAEFKRVNAIDQSNNEGKTAIETQTEVRNVIWHETYLYRKIDGVLYRVPMNESRSGITNAPFGEYFTVEHDGVDVSLGGEVVTIHPAYKNS